MGSITKKPEATPCKGNARVEYYYKGKRVKLYPTNLHWIKHQRAIQYTGYIADSIVFKPF